MLLPPAVSITLEVCLYEARKLPGSFNTDSLQNLGYKVALSIENDKMVISVA